METSGNQFGNLLTVKEAALKLNCAVKTIYNLMACGFLPRISLSTVPDSNRALRIPEAALDAFIENRLLDYLVDKGLCAYCKNRQGI